MPRVRAGEVTLYYETHGQGEPLLLINGFGSSSASWRPELIQGLARSFQVIAFDNRGTGQSDHPDEPWTLAQMADDAAALLDALAVPRAHVFGLSMGGMIAQEMALRHPRRVLGLVLGCTNCGAPVSVPASPEVIQLLMIPEGMDPREAARRAWPASYTPEFIAAHRDILEQTLERSLAHPTPLKTRRFQMEAIRAWSSHERLHQITAPTLIITGDRDLLIPPENSRILHERIAGSRLHVIPGAAHNFAGSHPEETVRVVTEFLRTVLATAPAD
ncbi:MAG: alpha/beta hydrolase [Chloroflexota bacterium]